ncbi:helix-turn-helix domain-containing protein [Elizabethkingia sp. JS20170427COW]|uniref:helix-turn-helix domain-containing protein n=1 Tax=Elizabethkingia sp. JS20170427COW TaxID=2583851 RepID=UPI0011101BDD|nr:helix-turn-helix domain-containing protein [Elizabethkingia sp. JS20170427COW]QCX52816.1 helix-turn-helix domain-containing protein [Elizabethkingia sp. JS20170427COW]
MAKSTAYPNYKRIYQDIIDMKFPEKQEACSKYLEKDTLSVIDINRLNKMIFGNTNTVFNQKLKSYSKSDILEILKFQKENKLNNIQTARHFKLSRNTLAKWKSIHSLS